MFLLAASTSLGRGECLQTTADELSWGLASCIWTADQILLCATRVAVPVAQAAPGMPGGGVHRIMEESDSTLLKKVVIGAALDELFEKDPTRKPHTMANFHTNLESFVGLLTLKGLCDFLLAD